MNILNILIKETKQNLRNRKAIFMMVLFPIVLIVILGNAMANNFDPSESFKDIDVIYLSSSTTQLNNAFKAFSKQGKDMGMTFVEAKNIDEGMQSIRDTKYSCFVYIKSDKKIELYKNERFTFRADLVQSVLESFITRYDAIMNIAKVKPESIKEIIEDSKMDFVILRSLGAKKSPGAMDYYGITMLTLIIMYSCMTGAFSFKAERTLKTEMRLLASPIKKFEIMLGKILGAIFVSVIQIIVVFIFSRYIFNANWGDNLFVVGMILFSEIVMAVALGVAVSFIFISDQSINGILNMIVPLFVFFGGGYFPIEQFGAAMQTVADASPVRWVNKSLMQVIYNNDYSSLATTLVLNFSLAAACIFIASISFRRERV